MRKTFLSMALVLLIGAPAGFKPPVERGSDRLEHGARRLRRRLERFGVQLVRSREVYGGRYVVLRALCNQPEVVLGPRVWRLGGEPQELCLGLIESAELEQGDALLAPRLAILRLVLQRAAGPSFSLQGLHVPLILARAATV